MTLNTKTLSLILVGIFFSAITLINVIGRWPVERDPQATTAEDYFASQLTPADINESFTFGDIDKHFNVLPPIMAQAFNLPEQTNSTAFAIKDLKTIYGNQAAEINTDSVRLFVALYNGMTYETDREIYLPRSAIDILLSRRVLLPEQVKVLDEIALILNPNPAPVTTTNNAGQSTERTIKGKTTFREVLDWGVPLATIEQFIGGPLSSSQLVVKDYCAEKGLDFKELKLALEEEASKVGHNH